jgi:hypothetical protein
LEPNKKIIRKQRENRLLPRAGIWKGKSREKNFKPFSTEMELGKFLSPRL